MTDTTIARRYDLILIHAAGIVWRHKDEGVKVDAQSISYMRNGAWVTRAFTDIVSVTLRSTLVLRAGTNYQCVIEFRDRKTVTVSTVNSWGKPDPARTLPYRDFVATLHNALIQSGATKSIAFRSGLSAGRSGVLIGALVIGAIALIITPLIIFLTTGQAKGLFLCLGGAVLILPALHTASRNRPGTYQPQTPPDLTA